MDGPTRGAWAPGDGSGAERLSWSPTAPSPARNRAGLLAWYRGMSLALHLPRNGGLTHMKRSILPTALMAVLGLGVLVSPDAVANGKAKHTRFVGVHPIH